MIDDSPEIQTTPAAAPSPQAGTVAPEPAPKSVSRPKADARGEARTDGKSEATVDVGREASQELRAEPAAEAKLDTKPDAKPRSKAKATRGTKGAGVSTAKGAKASEKAANAAIEARIGHHFADSSLLSTAFTHVSALKSSKKRGDSYQRLEFLGDHVLGLIVSDMLYRAFPSADEGELSKRLADLVRKESCADVAKSLGLLDDIKLGAVGAGAGARLRKSVLGDVCEAVIGAIFLDGGYAAAASFVERNWTERMRKPRRPLRDPKTVLQEWAQGKGLPTPVYREVERTGPHHDPQFRVAVDLPGLESAEGVGGSKRAAEKVAASVMIEREGVGGGSNDG